MFGTVMYDKYKDLKVLSAKDLDAIGNRMAMDYQKDMFSTPQPFNIEEYFELDRGFTPHYFQLGPDLKIHGCAVVETSDVPYWDPETRLYRTRTVSGNSAVFEEKLLDRSNPVNELHLR